MHISPSPQIKIPTTLNPQIKIIINSFECVYAAMMLLYLGHGPYGGAVNDTGEEN